MQNEKPVDLETKPFEMTRKISEVSIDYLEKMAAAWCKETLLPPSEAVIVYQNDFKNGRYLISIERKDEDLRKAIMGLKYYIDNPSAWRSFDQYLSDRLAEIVGMVDPEVRKWNERKGRR